LFFHRLTKAEKQNIAYKKEILTLATEHKKAADMERVNRFYMPSENEVRSCYYTL